jgi:multidrug efflux pump
VAITQLPVAQYPTVAPPSIIVTAAYPGASAQTLEDSVLAVIEQEMNGSPGLIYMESVSQANGSGTLTLSFEPGTNPTWRRWTCRTAWRAPRRACPAR